MKISKLILLKTGKWSKRIFRDLSEQLKAKKKIPRAEQWTKTLGFVSITKSFLK